MLDMNRVYESRIAALEAELTRCRTTETASAHALDTLRQHFGLDLIRGEHPADTARRIAREDDRQTNGAIRIADEAIDGTASALEAEVAELRERIHSAYQEGLTDGYMVGECGIMNTDVRHDLWIESKANRLLNKEIGRQSDA